MGILASIAKASGEGQSGVRLGTGKCVDEGTVVDNDRRRHNASWWNTRK